MDIKITYYVLNIFVFVYVVASSRAFDFFTVISLSSIFYFSPLLFGVINIFGVVYGISIDSLVYNYLSFYFFVLICSILSFDLFFKRKRIISIVESYSRIPSSFYILSLCFFLVGVYVAGINNLLNPDKTNLANESTALYGFSLWMICCSLVKSLVCKNRFMFAVFFSCLSFSLYVGSRSMFVIALLSLILVHFRLFNRPIRLVKSLSKVVLISVFVILLVLFKVSYKRIKAGDYTAAMDNIISLNISDLLSLLLTDPNAVVYNLNHSVISNYSLGWDYLIHRLTSLVPMMSSLYSKAFGGTYDRFSAILSNDYDFHFGLASSIHGELIAIGGLGLFVIATILLFFILTLVNYYYLFHPSISIALCIPFAVYNLFYSFRVDVTFSFGTLKTFVVISVVLLIFNNFKKLLRC